MIKSIISITEEIKKNFNSIYRKGTKEHQECSVDNLTQAYIMLQILEEVKGLREDLKVKVETIKASAEPIKPVAEEKPKAPAKK